MKNYSPLLYHLLKSFGNCWRYLAEEVVFMTYYDDRDLSIKQIHMKGDLKKKLKYLYKFLTLKTDIEALISQEVIQYCRQFTDIQK